MIKVEHKYFEEIELYIETFSPLHFFSKQVLDRLHYHMYIIKYHIIHLVLVFIFFSKQALDRLHRSHTYGI